MARIHGSRNQGMEMGVAPLAITPSVSLATFLLPVPMPLCSFGPEVLVAKGGMLLPRRHNKDSIGVDIKLAIWPLWAPHTFKSIGEEGNSCAGWGTDSDHQWKSPLHNGSKEENV